MLSRFAASKIRSIWQIWSEKKNAIHFDRIVLSGEKERQIFAQINQSDMICEKERNHFNFHITKLDRYLCEIGGLNN